MRDIISIFKVELNNTIQLMKTANKSVLFLFFLLLSFFSKSQINSLEISAEKEKMYSVYMLWRHSGAEGLADFKRDNPHEYLKELWYYSESFYIKRDHFSEGYHLNESVVAINRYENLRLENAEAIVVFPGSKDVLVMLPTNKLIYKP